MDHPKRQIPQVIKQLTEGSPAEQKTALDTYFLPTATFYHPLCRVPSFSHVSLPFVGEINSRWVIWMIYRWYKILSPRILLEVECGEFNQETNTLFLSIHQIFSLFFIPFYKSDVHLTTRLDLIQSPDPNHVKPAGEGDGNSGKWYIASQEDLYQVNEVVKFFWPGGNLVLWFFQMCATFACILGALTLAPVTWWEQRRAGGVNGVHKKF